MIVAIMHSIPIPNKSTNLTKLHFVSSSRIITIMIIIKHYLATTTIRTELIAIPIGYSKNVFIEAFTLVQCWPPWQINGWQWEWPQSTIGWVWLTGTHPVLPSAEQHPLGEGRWQRRICIEKTEGKSNKRVVSNLLTLDGSFLGLAALLSLLVLGSDISMYWSPVSGCCFGCFEVMGSARKYLSKLGARLLRTTTYHDQNHSC